MRRHPILGLVPIFTLLASSLTAQANWPVERAPAVTIAATATDGALQFSLAVAAARLSTGEIAIADAMDGMIRIAAPSGRVVRSFGRKGEGPGEFMVLTWLGRCSLDTLYAWDMRQARVAVFHPVSGFVRQFMPERTSSSFVAACAPTGDFAALQMPGRPGPASGMTTGRTSQGTEYQVVRMMSGLLVTDAAGAVRGVVPEILWGEMIAGMIDGRNGSLPRPLGGQTSFAFVGGNIAVGRSDSGTVGIFTAKGERVGGFSVAGERGEPTSGQYDRSIVQAIMIAPPQMHERLTAFALSVPVPTQLPAFSRLFSDPMGLIWVVTTLDGDRVTRLRGYRQDGQAAGNLELPFAFTVFEVGNDYVLGRTEDADGEQRVVLHRFTRR